MSSSVVAMSSRMDLPLIKTDCELSTSESMTLPNLVARRLETILREELMRKSGKKSKGFSGLFFFGRSVMLAQLILSKLTDPL